MFKKYLSIAFLSLVFFSSISCRPNILKGEGKQVTATRDLPSFNAVVVDVAVKVAINVLPGSQPGIQFKSYSNVLQHIKTRVENNALHIYTDLDDTWNIDEDDIAVRITMPSITSLSLSGAPDASITGDVTGAEFKIDISGSSDVKVDNLHVDNFAVSISGAGDIEVKGGAVKHATYEIDGAGDLKAYPLQADETTATISGAGTGKITALQKLTASINGAGTIHYKGHPAITKDVAGVGTISDAN